MRERKYHWSNVFEKKKRGYKLACLWAHWPGTLKAGGRVQKVESGGCANAIWFLQISHRKRKEGHRWEGGWRWKCRSDGILKRRQEWEGDQAIATKRQDSDEHANAEESLDLGSQGGWTNVLLFPLLIIPNSGNSNWQTIQRKVPEAMTQPTSIVLVWP